MVNFWQGKNVVVDDENWYIATRQSYTSLVKRKVCFAYFIKICNLIRIHFLKYFCLLYCQVIPFCFTLLGPKVYLYNRSVHTRCYFRISTMSLGQRVGPC